MRKNLLLLVASLAVALVAAEIAVRILLDPPQRVSYFEAGGAAYEEAAPLRLGRGPGEGGLVLRTPAGRRLRPNAHVIIENHRLGGRRVELRTNSLGYRNPEVGPKSERRRVLFLGDSVALGDWLPQELTFVRRVERLSQEAGDPVETINAAVGAIGLAEELSILVETGLSLQPDVVVLCFYLNDAQPSRAGRPIGAPAWLERSRLVGHLRAVWPRIDAVLVEMESVHFSAELRAGLEAELAAAFPAGAGDPRVDAPAFHREIARQVRDWGSAWAPTAQAQMTEQLRELAELGRRHDFELRIVAFPVSLQVQAEFLYDHPQQWLRRTAAEIDAPFLDMLPVLRHEYRHDPEDLFYDHCHHTARGNAIVAAEIWRFLQES